MDKPDKTPVIPLRLPRQILRALDARAKRDKLTRSALIRRLICWHLDMAEPDLPANLSEQTTRAKKRIANAGVAARRKSNGDKG